MEDVTRRTLLTATAAGGLLAAATAGAQTNEPVPQPQRPGHGGTDPGPRNLTRDSQNPDLVVPPSTDHGTLPNLRFFQMPMSGSNPAAGPGRSPYESWASQTLSPA